MNAMLIWLVQQKDFMGLKMAYQGELCKWCIFENLIIHSFSGKELLMEPKS